MSASDREWDDRPGDTAAELVITLVRTQIERGGLKPGDRLPAERDLARRVGVSRPSVRAGLRTLSAMGVVQTRHGSGTYIVDGPPALDSQRLAMLAALHGFRQEQMIEARRMLETGVAGLAAERATPDQLAAMAEEVTGMFAALHDPEAFALHDVRFHRALARASGNPLLAWVVEMVTGLYLEHHPAEPRTSEQLRERAERHRDIYHAVRARDPERARRELSQHLARADRPREPMLAMVRAR